ncbi:MAG: class I SAM-dependent methyltransferase [Gammaproteobacteria bacterium]|nr:class I SAM-dependent methyltransferase [Gammaproteobacteria bacterium]
MARFVALKYPKFQPSRVLDLGCTAGHNTAAWRQVFGEAEVTGIDVAAPCLRYAAARAAARGLALRFEQMNAESLDYPDTSFDLVFFFDVSARGSAARYSACTARGVSRLAPRRTPAAHGITACRSAFGL